MAGTNQVQAIIELIGEDKITKIVDSVERSFKDIRKEAKRNNELTKKYGKTLGKVAIAVDKIKNRHSKTTKITGLWIVKLHSAVALLSMAKQAAEGMVASLEEAGQSIAIEKRFASLADNAQTLRAELQKASGFQMDTTSLEQWASKAKLAGMEQGELSRVLNIAVKAANASGRDNLEVANQLLDSYVKGTGEALEQLGVYADLPRNVDLYAKSVGKSTTEITIAERRAVLMQTAVKGLADSFGDVNIEGTPLGNARTMAAEIANIADTVTRTKAQFMQWVVVMAGGPKTAIERMKDSRDEADRTVKHLLTLSLQAQKNLLGHGQKFSKRLESDYQKAFDLMSKDAMIKSSIFRRKKVKNLQFRKKSIFRHKI